MLITTTTSVEGKSVKQYLNIVSGETIIGANLIRDLFAAVRDIVGGRAGAYEEVLREAKTIAVNEMIANAEKLGANAIIGVDMDFEALGSGNSMLMVTATGTAVIVE